MKKFLIVVIMLLMGCNNYSVREVCDLTECSDSLPTTTSIIRDDISQVSDSIISAVNNKADNYLTLSFRHNTSVHYDEYGLHTHMSGLANNIPWGIDDNLMDSSISLMSLCILQKSGKYDVSSDISQLWTAVQNLQTSEGRLFRHPEFSSPTSISKDGIVGWMVMLSMAYHTDCEPIKSEASTSINLFKEYGQNNDWEYGLSSYQDPTTTKLTDRHKLKMLLNLYGLSTDNLDLSTSIHSLAESAKIADYINENKYYCQLGLPDACLNVADTGSYVNNLTFMSIVIAYIESLHKTDSFYVTSDLNPIFEDLARVGDNIEYPNYLFLGFYRYFVLDNSATYNDVITFLNQFPDRLPGEYLGINDTPWGCSDWIWQRTPFEHCSESHIEYTGNDFMLLYSITQF